MTTHAQECELNEVWEESYAPNLSCRLWGFDCQTMHVSCQGNWLPGFVLLPTVESVQIYLSGFAFIKNEMEFKSAGAEASSKDAAMQEFNKIKLYFNRDSNCQKTIRSGEKWERLKENIIFNDNICFFIMMLIY